MRATYTFLTHTPLADLVPPFAVADDHSHYHLYSSVSADDLNLDKPDHRVFFVGDIHGSLKQLNKLLDKLDYDEQKDVFVHVGDLVAKGPKSVEALELMRKYNVRGVRGNHDQPVSSCNIASVILP